jgi:thiol-disulfide isomerase/thioredoxin
MQVNTLKGQSDETGYRIAIDYAGYSFDSLYLGYYLGNSQYLRDTAVRNSEDIFVFQDDKKLEPGVYIVVSKPDNSFFQLIISEEEQNIFIHTDIDDPVKSLTCENCTDNRIFYAYMNYLGKKRSMADSLNALIKAEDAPVEETSIRREKLEELDVEVRAHQEEIVNNYPQTVSAAIIKAGWDPEVPDFNDEAEEDRQKLQYLYYKSHYFDNIPLSDKKLIRTPLLFSKVNNYIDRLTVQHPDSISTSLDTVLMNMLPNKEAFQYYLVHYLNKYAKSKVVGMDAVYVHLVDNYYRTGLADWTGEEQLKKILKNADEIKPTLIGKKAPPITVEDRNGKKLSVYDVDAEYTVLYFWRPDCPHCKKSTPFMIKFYENYRDKGVELLSVCMKFTDEVPKCWEYVDQNEGMTIFYNLVDPYHRSKFATLYNLKSTPQIFVLDKNKEIITKRIGAEQLEEVMEQIMQWDEKQKNKEESKGD